MNNYQLRLLLEAIVSLYSIDELMTGYRVKDLLSKNLVLSDEAVEVLVEGALELSQVRIKRERDPAHGALYLQ